MRGRALGLGFLALVAGGWASAGGAAVAAHPPVRYASLMHPAAPTLTAASGGPLVYEGGTVERPPVIYVVLWDFRYDPYDEADLLPQFMGDLGGSDWAGSITQYCEAGVYGSTRCTAASPTVTNPRSQFVAQHVWSDTQPRADHPTQFDIEQEAIRAAEHFGNLTAAQNLNAQYVIATDSGRNSVGWAQSYCAWHSAVPNVQDSLGIGDAVNQAEGDAVGSIAYINLPYEADSPNCFAGYFGGALDGMSIVGGHEYAETATDPLIGTGWIDAAGNENGDKCEYASIGPASDQVVTLNGDSWPVQSLWSNNLGGAGGCVTYYRSAGDQG
ncbi:MAG: hypothetical protein ACYDAY_09625 [Candidatus Dormibacteria bacterium]